MSTILTYTFLPNAVFIDSQEDLVLNIENPIDGKPVTFQSGRGGDIISIAFKQGTDEEELVTSLNFSADSQTENFTISQSFDITSTEDVVLNPGDTIRVQFNKMPINDAPGNSVVTITENIGESSETYPATITKKSQQLGVIAWLDPLVVGLDQTSTLYFKSSVSTKVVISGFPDGKGEKEQATPPYSGSYMVGVGSHTESQRTYTATAWANGNQSPPESVTLTQLPPIITTYDPIGVQTVAPSEEVTISWKAMFGSGTVMSWLSSQHTNVTSPFKSTPGTELTNIYNPGNNNAQFMPDSVTYTLLIQGFKQAAQQAFTFQVMPVQLVYLKYVNPDLTGILVAYDPSNWGAVKRSYGNNALTVSIYQPGGGDPDMYYLSTDDEVNPMIQYFEEEEGKLKWITANLKSLTLDPGGIVIDQGNIDNGSLTVPEGASEVSLSGVGKNGNTVRSVLTIEK